MTKKQPSASSKDLKAISRKEVKRFPQRKPNKFMSAEELLAKGMKREAARFNRPKNNHANT